LHILPEGVTIVDDKTTEFKFVNFKFKTTLNINSYQEADNDSVLIDSMQEKINEEFNEIIKRFSANDHASNCQAKATMRILEFFQVVKVNEEEKKIRNPSDRQTSDNNSSEIWTQNNLKIFLEMERKYLTDKSLSSKKTKIQMTCELPGMRKNKNPILRKFVIKTKKVNITDDLNEDQTLFMHMFIDTTQISQLEQVRAQNMYQKQMLANVSHEFRTPLNAMVMSLNLMKMTIDEKQRKFLNIANSSWNILSSLVEDILDHAKIESGVFEIHEVEFTFGQLLEEVMNIFELQLEGKRIELRIKIDEILKSTPIKSDKQRLKQILLNLISNAIKFTDKGYIQIKIKEKILNEDWFISNEEFSIPEEDKIESEESGLSRTISNYVFHTHLIEDKTKKFTDLPQLQKENDREWKKRKIVMTVKDSGIGIPLRDQKFLFTLFGKLSSNKHRNKSGWGLGLTICRKILQKLGGNITLMSKEGEGTKVRWTFIWKV
jgi:signal transduction histidine kinase